MSWDNNIYDNPEKYGLTEVGGFDGWNEIYSFDKFVVWKDESGVYYWAEDSGCSCPTPFEYYDSTDLLQHGSLDRAIDAAREWAEDYSSYNGFNADNSRGHIKVKDGIRNMKRRESR